MEKVLKDKFGFNSFRHPQKEIIENVLKKRDQIAIMATGKGKSICYQFPPVYLNKTAIIISPLISLQDDQSLSLSEKDIPVVVLNSNLKGNKRTITFQQVKENYYRIVFITPEFLDTQQEFLRELTDICLIAVDEAHCISSYGHNFRPSYRKLSIIRLLFPDVPIIALTATATPEVKQDIITQLKLKKVVETQTSFDRANIYLECRKKTENTINDIKPLLDLDNSNIIYCLTRKDTEEVAEELNNAGIKSGIYHAGLSTKIRQECHIDFSYDRVKVIVASIAFGMGIDKPNIRTIIVYGCPQDIESMYQQIGRAGRDGLPSRAFIFYSDKDYYVNKSLLEHLQNVNYKQHKMALLGKIFKFVKIQECRRKFIMEYFGEKLVDFPELCCDNCHTEKDKFKKLCIDLTAEYNLLKSLLNKVSLGINKISLILVGSNNQIITPKLKKLSEYGKGNNYSSKWWCGFIELLLEKDYVVKSLGEFPVLSLNKELEDNLLLIPNKTMNKETEVVKVNQIEGNVSEKELYNLLMNVRDELSQKYNIPPASIVSDTTIKSMCHNKPITDKEFLKLDGVDITRLKKYGSSFIETIKNYNSFNSMFKN